MRQCQKCQKPSEHPFGTFGIPSVSAFGKTHALLSPTPEKLTDRLNAPVQGTGADGLKLTLGLLWQRRCECPGAVPVLVCHDEVVIECDAEQAANAKAWLQKVMIEGMAAVINGTDEVNVPVEVEARIARSCGKEASLILRCRVLKREPRLLYLDLSLLLALINQVPRS